MDLNMYIRDIDIGNFISENYSLRVLDVIKLGGYEDINLKVRVHKKLPSSRSVEETGDTYVFKISHFKTDINTLGRYTS